MEKEEVKLSIELTVNQWNVVMNAVAQRSFAEVSGLIHEMKSQAEKSILQKNEKEATDDRA